MPLIKTNYLYITAGVLLLRWRRAIDICVFLIATMSKDDLDWQLPIQY